MIKRILAAVDGSPASLAALGLAAQWAESLKAELVAAFIADEQRFVYYPVMASYEAGVVIPVPLPDDRMQAELAKVKSEETAIRAEFSKIAQGKSFASKFLMERGDVNAILLREARIADLVVIGKRGRFDPPGSRQAGPTTETLIHDALRPVLVVPERSRTEGPFLFAYDDSKGVQRILPEAVDLVVHAKRTAVVLTVDDKVERGNVTQAPLKSYLELHGVRCKYVVERGKPTPAIIKTAEAEQAGMIVMGAFNRNPVYELFFGSTTLGVLERSPCPILLMS